MLNSGVVRKIDALGRLVIPVELRKTMQWEIGSPVEFYVEDGTVVLKKYEPGCVFCGEASGITNYKGKNICTSCLKELSK